jgi:drug/metabolite transporter (DMT)-like permease
LKFETKIYYWLALLFLGFTWGASFVLMKYGLKSFSYSQVAAIRMFSAFIVLLPFSIKNIKKINKKNITGILIVAFIGNCIPAFLFTIAQTKINSSLAGMLNASTPVFTLLFGLILFQTKTFRSQVIGVIIGLAGAIGLVLSNSTATEIHVNAFALFVVLATMMYGYNMNYVQSKLKSLNGFEIATLAFLFIGPVTGIYLAFTDLSAPLITPDFTKNLLFVLLLGIFGSAVAVIIVNILIQRVGSMFASSVTYIIPVFAVFWGIVDGEIISLNQILAILLILTGVYLINKKKKENEIEKIS